MAGFLLGALTALILMLVLVRPATKLVGTMRENPLLGKLLTAGSSQASAAGTIDPRRSPARGEAGVYSDR